MTGDCVFVGSELGPSCPYPGEGLEGGGGGLEGGGGGGALRGSTGE